MKEFETILINTYERAMFDITEIIDLNSNSKLKISGISDEKQAIRYFNQQGYYVSAARECQIYMTREITKN